MREVPSFISQMPKKNEPLQLERPKFDLLGKGKAKEIVLADSRDRAQLSQTPNLSSKGRDFFSKAESVQKNQDPELVAVPEGKMALFPD